MKKLVIEIVLSIHNALIITCSIFTSVDLEGDNLFCKCLKYLFILTAIGKSYYLIHKPGDKYDLPRGSRFAILTLGSVAIVYSSIYAFSEGNLLHTIFLDLIVAIGGYWSYLWIMKGNK